MWNHLMTTEPALTLGVISALLSLALGFGLPVSLEQVLLINAAVTAVMSWILRKKIDSPKTVDQAIQAASLRQPFNGAK